MTDYQTFVALIAAFIAGGWLGARSMRKAAEKDAWSREEQRRREERERKEEEERKAYEAARQAHRVPAKPFDPNRGGSGVTEDGYPYYWD